MRETIITALAEMVEADSVKISGRTVMYYEIIDRLNEIIENNYLSECFIGFEEHWQDLIAEKKITYPKAYMKSCLRNGAKYLELNKIKMPTAVQLDELSELNYLSKYKLRSEDDITEYGQVLEKLKSELSETEKILKLPKMRNPRQRTITKPTCGKRSQIMTL